MNDLIKEIARLKKENRKLKKQLEQIEKVIFGSSQKQVKKKNNPAEPVTTEPIKEQES